MSHAAPKSSLAPSRPRPRPAPRAPLANGWDPVWAAAARRGCRNLWQPLRAAQAPGASTARGHMYLTPGKTVAANGHPLMSESDSTCAQIAVVSSSKR